MVVYYLFVEIEESFGTVDIVERGEAANGTINEHRVDTHSSMFCHEHPVWVATTHKHLWTNTHAEEHRRIHKYINIVKYTNTYKYMNMDK